MAKSQRRFVIVTPHQSVGVPGTEVTSQRLGMNDEQLDDWVDAGHATEIFTQQPKRSSDPVSKVTRRAGDEPESDGASTDA